MICFSNILIGTIDFKIAYILQTEINQYILIKI